MKKIIIKASFFIMAFGCIDAMAKWSPPPEEAPSKVAATSAPSASTGTAPYKHESSTPPTYTPPATSTVPQVATADGDVVTPYSKRDAFVGVGIGATAVGGGNIEESVFRLQQERKKLENEKSILQARKRNLEQEIRVIDEKADQKIKEIKEDAAIKISKIQSETDAETKKLQDEKEEAKKTPIEEMRKAEESLTLIASALLN